MYNGGLTRAIERGLNRASRTGRFKNARATDEREATPRARAYIYIFFFFLSSLSSFFSPPLRGTTGSARTGEAAARSWTTARAHVMQDAHFSNRPLTPEERRITRLVKFLPVLTSPKGIFAARAKMGSNVPCIMDFEIE